MSPLSDCLTDLGCPWSWGHDPVALQALPGSPTPTTWEPQPTLGLRTTRTHRVWPQGRHRQIPGWPAIVSCPGTIKQVPCGLSSEPSFLVLSPWGERSGCTDYRCPGPVTSPHPHSGLGSIWEDFLTRLLTSREDEGECGQSVFPGELSKGCKEAAALPGGRGCPPLVPPLRSTHSHFLSKEGSLPCPGCAFLPPIFPWLGSGFHR